MASCQGLDQEVPERFHSRGDKAGRCARGGGGLPYETDGDARRLA